MNSFYLRASQFQDRVELPPKGAPANLPRALRNDAVSKSPYRVKRAWTLDDNDNEKPDGWDLFRGEEWCQRFPTKKMANDAKKEVEDEEKKNVKSNADEMPCECVDCGNRHTSIQSCGDMIEERLKRLAARRSGVEADPKPNTFVQRAQDPNI